MANFLKRWFTGLTTGTETPTQLETNIQDRLLAIEERLGLEHQTFVSDSMDASLATASGRHKPGAVSVCAYSSTAPANPTVGCMYYDTDTQCFYVWNGSSWSVQIQPTIPATFTAGMIMMWNSPTPPSGWLICDGTNGTPNFTLRYPMGASISAGYPYNSRWDATDGPYCFNHNLGSVTHLTGNGRFQPIPPFIGVYFIIKT